MQAEDEGMQSRALQALQSLAKGKRGGSKLPMQAIQAAFQQGKGLPRLVTLLDKVTTPRRSSTGQGKAIMAGAVDALAAMTRNNAAARHAITTWPADAAHHIHVRKLCHSERLLQVRLSAQPLVCLLHYARNNSASRHTKPT